MPGKVIRLKTITRDKVLAQRAHTVFMFGDNIARVGFGGQAAEMRGEPNTIGVPTKWRPSNGLTAFFTDEDWKYAGVRVSIRAAFKIAEMYLDEGFNVAIPTDGFGTGRADLANRAPRILAEIEKLIHELETR